MPSFRLPADLQVWVEARKRHRLSHAQVQMARELGMNPQKLGKIDNHRQEPWKAALPQFIERLYREGFGRDRPLDARPLRRLRAPRERRSTARDAGRRAVASRHYGEYRRFPGRHLSRHAPTEPALDSTCRASVARTPARGKQADRGAGASGRDFPPLRRQSRAPRVCEIAHQVFAGAGSCAVPTDMTAGDGLPEKMRMAPCRASVPLPFPTVRAGSWLVGRRAMPSAGTNR
jgi:hypothetical protein